MVRKMLNGRRLVEMVFGESKKGVLVFMFKTMLECQKFFEIQLFQVGFKFVHGAVGYLSNTRFSLVPERTNLFDFISCFRIRFGISGWV
ncbi:hypothetical protein C7R92_24095 [Brevibacillus porteri]|uniref:Transposase DDE domain-containing protein n=1 Tax=Brevibacillus porteri TaxID=2126350 RepID=A0ABX5FJZ3_9BACL|nr:hypothetical protein C7R92_24095 [Brevibacillus porteri]